jgi:hypothetical protein
MGQVIPDELTSGGVLVIACIAAEMLMPYSSSAGCALVRWAHVGQRLGTSA